MLFRSRAPADGSGFTADSQTGTRDTYQQALQARYGTDHLRLSLGYRWFHTNGFIPVPSYQRGPVDRTDDSRHQLFNGNLAWIQSSATTLTISGSLFREDRTFGTALSQASRAIGNIALGLRSDQGRAGMWDGKLFGQWQTFQNQTSQITPLLSSASRNFATACRSFPAMTSADRCSGRGASGTPIVW